MLMRLLTGTLSAIVAGLLDNYRRLSVRLLKIEATRSYVQGVRLARLGAVGLVKTGLLLVLVGIGILLLHLGLFVLLPGTVQAKAALAMVLGVGYVAAGGIALRAALDESAWMKGSGADDLMKEALGPTADGHS